MTIDPESMLYQTSLRGLQIPSMQKMGNEYIKLGKESAAIWMEYHQCPLHSNAHIKTGELC